MTLQFNSWVSTPKKLSAGFETNTCICVFIVSLVTDARKVKGQCLVNRRSIMPHAWGENIPSHEKKWMLKHATTLRKLGDSMLRGRSQIHKGRGVIHRIKYSEQMNLERQFLSFRWALGTTNQNCPNAISFYFASLGEFLGTPSWQNYHIVPHSFFHMRVILQLAG